MVARDSYSTIAAGSRRDELRGWLQLVLQAGAVARAGRRQLAEQVAGCELTEQEFLILWLCDDQPLVHRGQRELADTIGVSAAQMSGLVEKLRQRNLIQFERLGTDRRRQVWQLTTHGQALLVQLCKLLASRREEVHGPLTSDDQQQLLALLRRCLTAEETKHATTAELKTPDQGGPSSCAA